MKVNVHSCPQLCTTYHDIQSWYSPKPQIGKWFSLSKKQCPLRTLSLSRRHHHVFHIPSLPHLSPHPLLHRPLRRRRQTQLAHNTGTDRPGAEERLFYTFELAAGTRWYIGCPVRHDAFGAAE